MNKKILFLAAVIIVIIIAVGFKVKGQNFSDIFARKKILTEEEAKNKAADFINNNLMQPGASAEIKSVSKEGDLYKIIVGVQNQEITTYMSNDGSKFFPTSMDMNKDLKKDQAKAVASAPAKEIPKSDKPTVDLYVMSFCPFGNKAEDTLKPAYDLLKDKVDFNFRYIVTVNGDSVQSLHGEKEVAENEREACVMKNYGQDKWMEFVAYVNKNCGSDGACWEDAAKNSALDADKISSCVSEEGLALMQADEKVSKDAGASGSPTMLINGTKTDVAYQYGNSEAYKNAICGAFNSAPSECSQKLSAETTTAAGGSCAN